MHKFDIVTNSNEKKNAAGRIVKLRKEIERHRYLYHVLDKPEISDAALDSLKHELEQLEFTYPELITPDSPTQRIGGKARKEFSKVRHERAMLSFNDAFSQEEILAWVKRNEYFLESRVLGGWYGELKIDGLAVSLVYRDGILVSGSTRGEGIIGEDVTANLRTIEALPMKLRDSTVIARDLEKAGFLQASKLLKQGWPREIEVRGEVFMNTADFVLLNKAQKKAGLSPYANPRNVAAGSVRQLDPAITASRRLDSFAYDLINDFGQRTHEEAHAILKILGFKTNTHNKFCASIEDVFDFHHKKATLREGLPYEIDGIVVIVNDNSLFTKMGVIGKAPRGAVAYKFALKEAETIVENIKVQVGRTGALTPVATLKPVEIGGVTIRHASLHNADEIERLGLRIKDTVIVARAGDVIPKVLRVLPSLRPKNAVKFTMPSKCPSCGSKVEKLSGDVILRCKNKKCPSRNREWLYHFTSRAAFDIVGLGPKILNRLLDEGLIEDAADIFSLKPQDLSQLFRFGDKSAKNICDSIAKRKIIPLEKFIYALGIPNVGEETAIVLAQKYGSLDKIIKATNESLDDIEDIGSLTAQSIATWFVNKNNSALIKKFKKAGIVVLPHKKELAGSVLAGKTFVLTGSLALLTRDEAKAKIRHVGGTISESVSSNTNFVVVGSEPGEKYEKAKKLGIKTINEEEFIKMLQ